jgi:hypothetical protein
VAGIGAHAEEERPLASGCGGECVGEAPARARRRSMCAMAGGGAHAEDELAPIEVRRRSTCMVAGGGVHAEDECVWKRVGYTNTTSTVSPKNTCE